MQLKQVVKQLRQKGYRIKVYKRKDGGLLIKSINKRQFGGAMGNQIARELLGVKPSQKQLETNRRLVSRFIERKSIADLKGKALFNRVQRTWEIYKPNVSGKITWKKYEWNVKNLSKGMADEKLREAYRYARGLAYTENVNHALDTMKEQINKLDFRGLNLNNAEKKSYIDRYQRVIDYIENNRDKITERDLQEVLRLTSGSRNSKEETLRHGRLDAKEIIEGLEKLFFL